MPPPADELVQPGHAYHDAIHNCTEVAFALIQSEESLKSLERLGAQAYSASYAHCKDKNPLTVGFWARLFIETLRQHFVTIRLGDSQLQPGCDAAFVARDWRGDRGQELWNPGHTGTMYLRRRAAEAATEYKRAQQANRTSRVAQDNYERILQDMGIQIARQLVQCFYFSLAPDGRAEIDGAWANGTFKKSYPSYDDARKLLLKREATQPGLWVVLFGVRPPTQQHSNMVGSGYGAVTSSSSSSSFTATSGGYPSTGGVSGTTATAAVKKTKAPTKVATAAAAQAKPKTATATTTKAAKPAAAAQGSKSGARPRAKDVETRSRRGKEAESRGNEGLER